MRRAVVGVLAAGCSFSHGAAVPATPPGDASDGPVGLDAPPRPITELNTAGGESDCYISQDDRHLFFTRDGVLYESTR